MTPATTTEVDAATSIAPSLRGDRGEGVISTAIAVLIMALLGAAMWVTFDSIWSDTAENTEEQVEIIGSDGASG